MGEKFTGGVQNWHDRLGFVRNVVRQDLVSRQLLDHLPAASSDVRILDVGCGQGTQALHLGNLGYTVSGVDPSTELLKVANENKATLENVTFYQGTLEDLPTELEDEFDVVCCHGVLMYLDELGKPVQQLMRLVRPGGMLSILTRNQSSIAMRAGMKRDWEEVLKGFDTTHYKNNLGVENVRADTPEKVIETLQGDEAAEISWYGVRLFTDHWDDNSKLPEDYELLAEAEYEAGKRDPYRQLASLAHFIVVKN